MLDKSVIDTILKNSKPGVYTETPYGKVFIHPKKGRRYIKKTNGVLESFPKFLLSQNGVDLPKGTDIHHMNENKLDDRIENYDYSDHHDHARNHMNFNKKAEIVKNQLHDFEGNVISIPADDYQLDSPIVIDIANSLSISELVRYDWDKLAFGISSGETIKLPLDYISLVYFEDVTEASNKSGPEYFNNADPEELPPVQVKIQDGIFKLEDGHHRYIYSKNLGKDTISVTVSIFDNPFNYLGYQMDDVIRLKKSMENKNYSSYDNLLVFAAIDKDEIEQIAIDLEKDILELESKFFDEIYVSEIGKLNECAVFLVNGDTIKIKHEMDFCEGGNSQRYPEFIPKDEIWIEVNIHTTDIKFIMLHEYIENRLMRDFSLTYDKAHDIANEQEKSFRKKYRED
jgi:hypothetical protein